MEEKEGEGEARPGVPVANDNRSSPIVVGASECMPSSTHKLGEDSDVAAIKRSTKGANTSSGTKKDEKDGAPPPVREANMDADEAPFPSEGNEDGVLDKQQDGVAPALNEANMDVDEASFPREDTEHHAATESKTEVNECGALEKQQDVAASVMGKTKIVVDESSAPQQDHTVAAAPSEGDSRVVDQHPNTSDGGFPVKKDEEGM
ncbi:hypothetical protein TRIUR3_17116 [Triticum urartu]|uniref:Uncharacterized protein n=1 Tax=Triticum urartu TaxID=4572 RepID=M7Z9A8_TRIUA|nr:hypothetical protein TRIUR3_17116 [Triticum urartu]